MMTFAGGVTRALRIKKMDLELKRGKEGTTLVKNTNPPKKAYFDIRSQSHQQ